MVAAGRDETNDYATALVDLAGLCNLYFGDWYNNIYGFSYYKKTYPVTKCFEDRTN